MGLHELPCMAKQVFKIPVLLKQQRSLDLLVEPLNDAISPGLSDRDEPGGHVELHGRPHQQP